MSYKKLMPLTAIKLGFVPYLRALTLATSAMLMWLSTTAAQADRDMRLLEVPDYQWYAGCFGTACGNLMGYWDRHGFPDFYTGPTTGGVAPLSDWGNEGIRSLWASQAGFDGRPAGQYGHMDDYYLGYEYSGPDPYVVAGRAEHTPDCIGDFIGLSQNRWTNMNNECDGNIDAYSFTYWDTTGNRRTNFLPPNTAGLPARDIPSGLRAWTRYRGYDADVFSQLVDFNPTLPAGNGFTFEHLKAEIDAGYPVLLFMQPFTMLSEPRGSMLRGNPPIHGMLAYGYAEYPGMGLRWVYYRTSWGSGDGQWNSWGPDGWPVPFPLRGVMGYHPKPRIRSILRNENGVTISWEGPASQLQDTLSGVTTNVHRYRVEQATRVDATLWTPVGTDTTDHTITFVPTADDTVFYRVRLLAPGQ